MQKLKKQRGITLIALIITVIVMLILVGVTISASLNGGLFTRAKEAANEQTIATEKDTLQTSALLAIGSDGKVDYSKIILSTGFTGSNGTYTSSNGNRYAVSKSGEVTYLEGKLASYVQYKNLKWRVLKDDETGVELLCDDAIGEATLISDDDSWPGGVAMIQARLNALSQQALGGIANVRSVKISDQPMADSLGLMAIGTEYFVATYDFKPVEDGLGFRQYYTYSITSTGEINPIYLFTINEDDDVIDYEEFEKTACLRPVATLGAGALDNLEGSGTLDDPYILAD